MSLPERIKSADLERKLEAAEAKLKAQEKRIQEMLATMHKERAAKRVKLVAAPKQFKLKGDIVRMVASDVHGSQMDKAAVAAFLGDVKAIQPNEVILNGDIIDCGGFLAEHHTLGYVAEASYTYTDDCAAANGFLDALESAAPNAKKEYIEGNHECLPPDHQVLTTLGWVPIADVTMEHTVAAMSDTGETQWVKPLAVHSYDYTGDLITHSSSGLRVKMTPEHRLWYWNKSGDTLLCRKAKYLNDVTSPYDIPTSGKNLGPDANFSDNDIRLLAWILTDGCISNHKVVIYQSKQDRVAQIRNLLSDLNLAFSEAVRVREKLPDGFKSALPAHVFYITGEDRKRILKKFWALENREGVCEKKLPSFVSTFSERQVDLFVETLLDGDGTRVATGGEKSGTLYGLEPFLDAVQCLLVVNGYRCSLARRYVKKNNGWYVCLNITKRDFARIVGANIHREKYSGKVHCLTTQCDNFFIRHRGIPSLTGNSRVETFCLTTALRGGKDAEFLRKAIAPEFTLGLAGRGIKYYRTSICYDGLNVPGVIKRGKIYYLHGISTAKNAAAETLRKICGNVNYAHTHRAQSDIVRRQGTGVIGAWNPGALCHHQPLWQHGNPTEWTEGFSIEFISRTGNFLHLNVPIIDGVSHLTKLLHYGPAHKAA